MERLTIKGATEPVCARKCEYGSSLDCYDCDKHKELLNRLAAYEDTGVEPENIPTALEMAKIFSALQKLKEYQKAEMDGRLVVLPCKVGDTVYVFYTGRRNCKWPCNTKKKKVYEVNVSGMRLHDWSDDWSVLLFFDSKEMTGDYEFSFDEFGKTIFQTRAEADTAMKGVSEDG